MRPRCFTIVGCHGVRRLLRRILAWAALGLVLSACSTASPHPFDAPVVRPDVGRVKRLPNLGPCIYEGHPMLHCPPRA